MPAHQVNDLRVQSIRFVHRTYGARRPDALSFGFAPGRTNRRPRVPRCHRREMPRRRFPRIRLPKRPVGGRRGSCS
jgi:hypothetical protein